MGSDWRQTGLGMRAFVERLPGVLQYMLGGDTQLPRIVASDRGLGFYQGSTGHIVREYSDALTEHGFRPWVGDDASHQPADIPDVLLHETVVAWIRSYLQKHPLCRTGSLDAQEARLRILFNDCAAHINGVYDVDGLCRQFPTRLENLINGGGERLKH